MPSEKFKQVEAENAKKEAAAETQEAVSRTVVYWTYPKKFRLANYVPEEILQSGRISRVEQPLRWEEHILTVDPNEKDGQKKIDYIEASNAFAGKQIIKCKDMADAARRTSEQNAKLSVRETRAQDISSTEIKLPNS